MGCGRPALSPRAWNPVKELKDVFVGRLEVDDVHLWNPVKELKGPSSVSITASHLYTVESGEGIERLCSACRQNLPLPDQWNPVKELKV